MLRLDTPRCIGQTTGAPGYILREPCRNCQRRTAPRAEAEVWRDPPTTFPCQLRIAPVGEIEFDVDKSNWPFPQSKPPKLTWWQRFRLWLIGGKSV